MLDNLYLDKLTGRITESEYDRFYTSLRDQLTDLNIQLSQLQEAEDNYNITAKYVLDLANRAHDLFESSEVFDVLLNCSDRQAWCAQQDSNLRPTD